MATEVHEPGDAAPGTPDPWASLGAVPDASAPASAQGAADPWASLGAVPDAPAAPASSPNDMVTGPPAWAKSPGAVPPVNMQPESLGRAVMGTPLLSPQEQAQQQQGVASLLGQTPGGKILSIAASGPAQVYQGAKDLDEGIAGKAFNTYRDANLNPQQVTPQQQAESTGKMLRGGAELVGGAGQTMAETAAPGMLETGIAADAGSQAARLGLAKLIAGIESGNVAGAAADRALKAFGFSQDAQNLGATIAQFLPSMAGEIAGVHADVSDVGGKGKGVGVSAFGGKVQAGVGATPESFGAGVKVGDRQVSVNIPRQAPTDPVAVAAQEQGQQALQAMVTRQRTEQAASAIVKGVPPPQAVAAVTPQPPPTPQPPKPAGMNHGELTPQVIQDVGRAISYAAPADRGKLLMEAHGNLAGWMAQQGRVLIDGEIHIVKTPEQAQQLAAKLVNGEVARQDAARNQATQPASQTGAVAQKPSTAAPDTEQAAAQDKLLQRATTLLDANRGRPQNALLVRQLRVTPQQAADLVAKYRAAKLPAIGSKEEPVVEEAPATVNKQVEALQKGTIPAVMIPKGAAYTPETPEGMQTVEVAKGPGAGTYLINPEQVTPETVKAAAKAGTHGDLMGHIADKEMLAKAPGTAVVQAVAPDGTPIQDSEVPADRPDIARDQAQVLAERHPGAEIAVKPTQQVLEERAAAQPKEEDWQALGAEPEKAPEAAPAPEKAALAKGDTVRFLDRDGQERTGTVAHANGLIARIKSEGKQYQVGLKKVLGPVPEAKTAEETPEPKAAEEKPEEALAEPKPAEPKALEPAPKGPAPESKLSPLTLRQLQPGDKFRTRATEKSPWQHGELVYANDSRARVKLDHGMKTVTMGKGESAKTFQKRDIETTNWPPDIDVEKLDGNTEAPEGVQLKHGGMGAVIPQSARDYIDDLTHAFLHPEELGEGKLQAGIERETRGEMDRRIAIVAKALEPERKLWSQRSSDDSLAFFNAVETGNTASLPENERALADAFKESFDTLRGDIQALKPEALRDYIENYFPHIWENHANAASILKQVLAGRRPFAGSGSFLKQRTIPTIQDGVDMGLRPVSWNPVDLFLLKYQEMSRFLMAHQTLEAMKEAGTAQFVGVGQQHPDGWSQLDDRIGTVQSRNDDGELVIRGHYYAPAEAARIFNNFVSRGFAGRSRIYDGLRWINDNLNAFQLGISGFHAATTSVNAVASDVASGIEQLGHGELSGFKDLAQGLLYAPSIVNTFRNGSKLMSEYLKPGSYAKFSKEADAIATAGGRVHQNLYEIKPLQKVREAIRNAEIARGLGHLPSALIELSTRPVMEYFVPRMKLGAFYDMAHASLNRAAREGWSAEQTRDAVQKAWDSVDNRFGQMVYDNLFWHKAVRDGLALATRSVGWNAGTIREIGGGAVDTVRAVGRAATGERPEVSHRMAFVMGMTVATGLMGAVATYLFQHHAPQTAKDLFFPQKQDGTRLSIPGYMKDVYAYKHAPFDTLAGKIGPLMQALSELYENQDFRHVEIRDRTQPLGTQVAEVAKYLSGQMIPFAVRNVGRLDEDQGAGVSGGVVAKAEAAMKHPGNVALAQFGFSPAPGYVQNSPALEAEREYARAAEPPGSRTEQQYNRQQARYALEREVAAHNVDPNQLREWIHAGLLTLSDVDKAEKAALVPKIVSGAKSLTLRQLLDVYGKATPEEQRELRPVLARKGEKLPMEESDPMRRASLRAALRRALSGEPAHVGIFAR